VYSVGWDGCGIDEMWDIGGYRRKYRHMAQIRIGMRYKGCIGWDFNKPDILEVSF
jgi:hypothetical protein